MKQPGFDGLAHRAGDQITVDDGRGHGQTAIRFHKQFAKSLLNPPRADAAHILHGFAAQRLHHRVAEGQVFFHGVFPVKELAAARAGTQHRPAEQPLGLGGNAQHLDAHAARALAHEGHVVRVAAEGRNVVPHPSQGGQLVVNAIVAGMAAFSHALGGAEEAEWP